MAKKLMVKVNSCISCNSSMKINTGLCCKELCEIINVEDGDIYDSCPLRDWDDCFVRTVNSEIK